MSSAFEKQVGGNHYKKFKIQPLEFCQVNRIPYCEANVIKYVCRHASKNGAQDIEKAIHNLEFLLQLEYPDHVRKPKEADAKTPVSNDELIKTLTTKLELYPTHRYKLASISSATVTPVKSGWYIVTDSDDMVIGKGFFRRGMGWDQPTDAGLYWHYNQVLFTELNPQSL